MALNTCKVEVTTLIEELKEMDIPEEDEKTLTERIARAKTQARVKMTFCFQIFPGHFLGFVRSFPCQISESKMLRAQAKAVTRELVPGCILVLFFHLEASPYCFLMFFFNVVLGLCEAKQ